MVQASHYFTARLNCSCAWQELRDVVQALFRGGCSHETVCLSCGRPSVSSARVTDFYELDLGIKSFKTLAESLVRSAEDFPAPRNPRCTSHVCAGHDCGVLGLTEGQGTLFTPITLHQMLPAT